MQDIKLRDIVSPRKVVTVSGNQTAQDVLNLLSMHHISAVPVMSDDHRTVMGFVDVLDILAFLVKTSSKPLTDTGVGESRSLTTDDLLMIHKRTKDFKMAQVTELIDLSKRNPFRTFQEDALLSDVTQFFKEGIHRVAITNLVGQLIGVFSQMDLINWISQNRSKFPNLREDYEISRSTYKTDKIVSVPSTTMAVDAFIFMHRNATSSLAILGPDGRLIGTLSASDIKFDMERDLRLLLRPVQEYINIIHTEAKRQPDFLVCCKPSTKMTEAMATVTKNHVHRIFVCDENEKPMSVVSLTDMIQEVTKGVAEAH